MQVGDKCSDYLVLYNGKCRVVWVACSIHCIRFIAVYNNAVSDKVQ